MPSLIASTTTSLGVIIRGDVTVLFLARHPWMICIRRHPEREIMERIKPRIRCSFLPRRGRARLYCLQINKPPANPPRLFIKGLLCPGPVHNRPRCCLVPRGNGAGVGHCFINLVIERCVVGGNFRSLSKNSTRKLWIEAWTWSVPNEQL